MQLWPGSKVSSLTHISVILWAAKPVWFLSDAYWQLRRRTNSVCIWDSRLNPVCVCCKTCANLVEVQHMGGWTCFTWSERLACVFESQPTVTFHPTAICPVIPLSVLETRTSEGAGRVRECVNVSLWEVWICGAADNAWLVSSCHCFVLSELLFPTHTHTHTHTHTFHFPPTFFAQSFYQQFISQYLSHQSLQLVLKCSRRS